jgi:pimeloyl-ACP methyl ester carboxylesterase
VADGVLSPEEMSEQLQLATLEWEKRPHRLADSRPNFHGSELVALGCGVGKRLDPPMAPARRSHQGGSARGVQPGGRTTHDRENQPWDLVPTALDVDTPMLVIAADPDEGGLVRADLGDRIAAANPCVTFRVLAGAGHSMHRD